MQRLIQTAANGTQQRQTCQHLDPTYGQGSHHPGNSTTKKTCEQIKNACNGSCQPTLIFIRMRFRALTNSRGDCRNTDGINAERGKKQCQQSSKHNQRRNRSRIPGSFHCCDTRCVLRCHRHQKKGECNAQTVSKRKIRGNISGENGVKDNIICDNVTLRHNDHDPNNHRGNYRIARRNGPGCQPYQQHTATQRKLTIQTGKRL